MQILFSANSWKNRKILLSLLYTALLVLITGLYAQAGAPPRAKPYAESICNTDSNIFFCEDFEGQDIATTSSPGTNGKYWNNPAIETADLYWSMGGSHQRSTIPLSGFDQATNRIWRVTKTKSFTDINTGINTGTGSGLLSGWLRSGILGSGAREWYTRMQVYFSSDHRWPEDLDFKMFYALPRQFIDAPSAVYETGMTFHQDFWCSGYGNFNNVVMIRYSSRFALFPSPAIQWQDSTYCPPLAEGTPPDGVHAPRIAKGRWYTLEYRYKLSSSPSANDGILEFWVDGVKAYSTTRNTCDNGCPDMGFIMILGWMNSADPQSGYYEIDNVVMSRRYIGPPDGASSPDTTPPAAPTGLTVTAQ